MLSCAVSVSEREANRAVSTGANFTVNQGGIYTSQGFNLSNQNDVAIFTAQET
jgi:hypothetical protein